MTNGGSLSRMLAILSVFTEDRLEWTSEELLETLGYSRPTLYRYLKILREHGLLASLPNAGFTLGPKVVELDFLLRRSDPLILAGHAHLVALSDAYPSTAFISRWYGNRVLCVDSVRSAPYAKSSYPRGRPMAVGRGAVARSIIAFLPRRQLIPVIESNFKEFRAVGLGDTEAEVLASLRKVRSAGVAIAHGEVTQGVFGIAAPVFDAGRTPIASVCVTITDDPAIAAPIDTIASEVRKAAETLSDTLGRQRSEGDPINQSQIATLR